jgi:hypothetical protein
MVINITAPDYRGDKASNLSSPKRVFRQVKKTKWNSG